MVYFGIMGRQLLAEIIFFYFIFPNPKIIFLKVIKSVSQIENFCLVAFILIISGIKVIDNDGWDVASVNSQILWLVSSSWASTYFLFSSS